MQTKELQKDFYLVFKGKSMELKLNLKSEPFSVRKVKKSSKLDFPFKLLLLHYLTLFYLVLPRFSSFSSTTVNTHLLYINIKKNGHIINILHTLCANSLLLQENEPLFDAIAKCDDKKKDITGCQNIRTRSVKQRLFLNSRVRMIQYFITFFDRQAKIGVA